jgi:hypothetical protein
MPTDSYRTISGRYEPNERLRIYRERAALKQAT